MDIINQIVAKNIRRLMDARGMSQIDLSNEAKISNSHLNKVLNGKRRAGPDIIEALTKALSCQPEEIYGAKALLFNDAISFLQMFESALPSAQLLALEILAMKSEEDFASLSLAMKSLSEDSEEDV